MAFIHRTSAGGIVYAFPQEEIKEKEVMLDENNFFIYQDEGNKFFKKRSIIDYFLFLLHKMIT